ncbi:MAG TPA: hypothetical protein VFX48_02755 [Saprospiraceae bacterium]|nr:hypothetical protein [Saprospiraceae bacterium]
MGKPKARLPNTKKDLMKPHFTLISSTLVALLAFTGELKADFRLVCPSDITISCREDYFHDLNAYGRAYTDYNGVIQYQHDCKTIVEIDDCGKGTIKRVWGVENPENWQWLSCTQVITISNAAGFTYQDVSWPPSIVLESCNPREDLKNLQAPYDAPSWERPKCAKPMISYKDTRFKVNDGCEKILREWKILDWCQYDPILYPGRGIFSYTQVIKLISTSDSLGLECKRDTIVLNNRNCDSIYVQLEPAKLLSGCPIYHQIRNTSAYAIDSGANASGYYPNGITKFYYTAEYACGKEIKCEVTVDVRNTIPPTPYCLTGVILTLMPVDLDGDGVIDNGMVEVWASDLDKGSWHICPQQKLRFSFSPDPNDRSRQYDCSHVGLQEVDIWVTDSLGNQDVCKTSIEIQNNNPAIPNCDGNLTGNKKSISGEVLFYHTKSPDHFQVSLTGNGTQLLQQLGPGFVYRFDDLAPATTYRVQASGNQFDPQQIDYLDLAYLKKMIDGKLKPGSPYAWIAADINSDHLVNESDYQTLRQVLINKRVSLIRNPWQVVPAAYAFTDPTDPFRDVMPDHLLVDPLNTASNGQDFMAIRTGDLVSGVQPDREGQSRSRTETEQGFYLLHHAVFHAASGMPLTQWTFFSAIEQELLVQFYDLDGRICYDRPMKLVEGVQTIEIPLEARGLMIYRFGTKEKLLSGKFLIQGF